MTDPAVPEVDRTAARAERRAKRQFANDDTAPPDLRSSEVAHEFWPTRAQYTRWWMYVDPALGILDDGWWYAQCPIHDPEADGDISAQVNFKHGMLRCLDETAECHKGRKGMTLTNVIDAVMVRLTGGASDGEAETQSV
jgi:hypothetical protein